VDISKKVEKETLATFMRHRPSEYFSHIGDLESFQQHHRRVELLYRFGLVLPPEFFQGRKLIDLGSGTGENTVSLAKWGAICTLVEMNIEAVKIAKSVFNTHVENFHQHEFIISSLFDIDINSLEGSFDISHSRGVFTHVADKKKAFKILASLAKPGGYVIYGDRNTLGGLQEMIQRFAIYRLGGANHESIVEIAEALFSTDIDRSHRAVPRTREAIIFDRWVIQQQDDPSVDEVLNFFESEGLEYVSSWPRIDFLGRGTSTYSDPRSWNDIRTGAQSVETLWMILNRGEHENILSSDFLEGSAKFLKHLAELGSLLRNLQIPNTLVIEDVLSRIDELIRLLQPSRSTCSARLITFFSEILDFLALVQEKRSLAEIRLRLDRYEILFKGYAGVKHVDYLAYKPKR
jgi:SAM-dependent methyltransferase